MTYHFETYGCQMNSAESAALELVCRERGWKETSCAEEADLVLLNTCSVRETAEQRVLGRIAHYAAVKKKRRIQKAPPLTIVIAGCMASRLQGELITQFPQIDYVMGTQSRYFFPLILEAAERGEKADITLTEETPAFSFSQSHMQEGSFRSFIPIMHGCNNFCSYCIVPYVRGREVSRNPVSIVEEIRLVAERGVKEVTLLGQNVNSYFVHECVPSVRHELARIKDKGEDGFDFTDLLEFISKKVKETGVKWIRFLSANPKNFSKETIKVMAENTVFCRHIHLPVQHGSDKILQAMNRGYTREQFLDLIREIRSAMPGITLSTDILVGFPGETEEDFRQIISLMEEVQFLYSYMYHYNPRQGTKAYDMSDRISEEVKKERLARVIDLQLKQTNTLLKERIGSTETVLIEGISRNNADELITRTERDEMAVIPGSKPLIGSFVKVRLTGVKGNTLQGTMNNEQ